MWRTGGTGWTGSAAGAASTYHLAATGGDGARLSGELVDEDGCSYACHTRYVWQVLSFSLGLELFGGLLMAC